MSKHTRIISEPRPGLIYSSRTQARTFLTPSPWIDPMPPETKEEENKRSKNIITKKYKIKTKEEEGGEEEMKGHERKWREMKV